MYDSLKFVPVGILNSRLIDVNLMRVEVGVGAQNAETMSIELPLLMIFDGSHSHGLGLRVNVGLASIFNMMNWEVRAESLLGLQDTVSGNVIDRGFHSWSLGREAS